MATYHYGHSFPRVFICKGAALTNETTKTTADLTTGLTPGWGVFDKKTFANLDHDGFGPAYANKQFIFAQGSVHSTDTLTGSNPTDMYGGLQESVKSPGILMRNVRSLSRVNSKTPLQEKWTIGWDGAAACAPELSCDSVYTIRIEAKGDYILKKHNRNFYKEYSVQTECCDGCETCTNGTVDPYKVFKKMADEINADPEMSGYVQASVITDTTWVPDGYSIQVTVTLDGATDDATAVKGKYDGTGNNTSVTAVAGGGSNEFVITYAGPFQASAANGTLPVVGDTVATDDVSAVSGITWVKNICATIPTDGEAGSTIVSDLNTWIGTLSAGAQAAYGTAVLTSEGDGAVVVTIPVAADATVTFDGEKWSAEPTYAYDELVYPYPGSGTETIVNVTFTGENCPCATATAYSGSVGLLLEGAFVEKHFGDCSFHPTDHYNLDAIRFEMSLKDDALLCNHDTWRVVKRQSFRQAVGLGESILREYLVSNGYRTSNERFEFDARLREAEDQLHLDVLPRRSGGNPVYYTVFYLNYIIPWGDNAMGMTGLNNDHAYTLKFICPTTDTTAIGDLVDIFTEISDESGVAIETY